MSDHGTLSWPDLRCPTSTGSWADRAGMLVNPFVIYTATFGAILAIYQLGWSDAYPDLSSDLLIFFAATFVWAAPLAWIIRPLLAAASSYTPGLLPRYTGLLVVATFLGEIALAGGVPLLMVMGGAKFYDLEAGATHLHAFVLWSVYSAIRFADFMYSRRPHYLLEAVLPVIFYGLMVYRGPALICVLSWLFVFAIRCGNSFRIKHAAFGIAAAFAAVFANGLLGDVRSPGQERIGAPSQSFNDSRVPRTLFWTYLYATVGIANLQLSVDTLQDNQGSAFEFIVADLVPDTISRRILTSGESFQSRDQLYSWAQPHVAKGINVSTIYGRAYGFFGWYGTIIMFAALSALIVTYLVVIQWTPYFVPCLALLNTLVVMCIFNNMMVSAAMIPLLVLPLLLPPWGWLARLGGTTPRRSK